MLDKLIKGLETIVDTKLAEQGTSNRDEMQKT